MRDVGEEGDNVQVSAWLSLDRAVELRDELIEAIEGARERDAGDEGGADD